MLKESDTADFENLSCESCAAFRLAVWSSLYARAPTYLLSEAVEISSRIVSFPYSCDVSTFN